MGDRQTPAQASPETPTNERLAQAADMARAALSSLCVRDATLAEVLGGSEKAAQRIEAATAREDGGLRLDVMSDGLDLDAKAAVEKALRREFGAWPSLTVYFKRSEAQKASAGPAPLRDRKAPFGLSVDRRAIPGVTEIVVVASGKGGVGKSTVSVNLAVSLAQAGSRVGLLDADIYGPSAPLMMGLSRHVPQAASDKLVPPEAHGVKVMSFGFLTDVHEPVIWRGPLIAKAFRQLAYDVAWGELDYLIIDLPPGTGDIQLALVENLPIHGALIVSTPQDVALLDAHKALSMFERLEVPVIGLVENMAHFHCPACGHAEPVFGEGGAERMARERRLPLVAQIPLARAVRSCGDEGRPVALQSEHPAAAVFKELAALVRRSQPSAGSRRAPVSPFS